MIPQRIQSLFDFIDYLNDNKKEYIEKYLPLCDELENLDKQRAELKPGKNYQDKLKYDKVQSQIEKKFEPITTQIYLPITNKLKDLGIWNGDNTYSSIWNNNISAISEFKKNFESNDVSQVMTYKLRYLHFRIETNSDFLCLYLVFQELDEIFKELFDFFKDTNKNEFDSFETKSIEVNSIEEAIKSFIDNKRKNVSFSIPSETLFKNPSNLRTEEKTTNINTEFIMGDKIHIENIHDNNGTTIVGKDNKVNTSDNDLAKKSFNWQKWGIIIASILAIIGIILMIK